MSAIFTRDDVFRFICFITFGTGETFTGATGIFVGVPSEGHTKGWIVTATHVAKLTNENSKIYFADDGGNAMGIKLSCFGDVNSWKHHHVADMSVFPIVFNDDILPLMKNRFLPIDHFNLQRKSLSRDCELTFVGFPNNLGMLSKFSPMTFRTYPASDMFRHKRFDNHVISDFFCLEHPSIGGCSGGPAIDFAYRREGGNIVPLREKLMVYGIMHGTISDGTGGKIALVTPTHYLKDLILGNS